MERYKGQWILIQTTFFFKWECKSKRDKHANGNPIKVALEIQYTSE